MKLLVDRWLNLVNSVSKMWNDIGYSPEEVEIASLYDDHGDEQVDQLELIAQQTGGAFSPKKAKVLCHNMVG